ncbi:MAG: amino acid adenylation domain-containing protein [Legionellaceae bacterium]|nr:amino acid adenylation domain-containing protein [Legionellaceae bacterium]
MAKYNFSNTAHIQYPIGIKEASSFIYGGQVNNLITRMQFAQKDTFINLLDNFYFFVDSMRVGDNLKHSYLPAPEVMVHFKDKRFLMRFSQAIGHDIHSLFDPHAIIHSDTQNNTYGSTLGLEYEEKQDQVLFRLIYRSDYCDDELMHTIATQYQQLLRYCAQYPEQEIATHCILSSEDYQKIIYDWNKTKQDYPNKTLHELFEEQVKKTPNNIAVVFEGQQLTYKQLNEEANQLARYICKQNPGELVAICMDRSLEMMVAILGILKAGCAYVPIDPSYPQERIDYILEDTKASLVLDNSLKDGLYRQGSKKNLSLITNPHDLAYVIYTSGTTGKPKGVMIAHSGIVNRLHWMQQQYPLNECDVVLHKTPYHFDVSVWELLWAHQYGAKLVIAKPQGHKDSEYLYQLMLNHRITITHFVPSMLSAFTQAMPTLPSALRYIFCSGEALSVAQVNAAYAIGGSLLEIHNLYGPTEASIDVTAFACERGIDKVYIGKPIQNIQVYVLDQALQLIPIGVIGELYIGGAGLARGYLNQPKLTKERFINNPFGEGRLYKTGDLVRWLADGNIEYIGRNDFQVKIRGYRIELGEIESALSMHPDIKQCAVLSHDAKLIAYYVGQTKRSLEYYLRNKLPDYMIPSVFIKMESFPLTINGKLDRKALPAPDFTQNQAQYIAPRNANELLIAQVFQSVLKLERIGIQDDFFRLGGDSIQSIQVSSRLQREGMDIRVRDIFTQRTIQALATSLSQSKAFYGEQGLLTGSFGLLPIQQWFFAKQLKQPGHWNQSFIVRTPELSVARLNEILGPLMERHDVLRLRFKDGQQTYTDSTSIPAIKTAQDFESCTAWQSHFNLEAGPLWQMGYIAGGYLFFAAHHLIIDGVSWRILIDDIQRLYAGDSLGVKSSSYRQWVAAVERYPTEHPTERDYWLDQVTPNQEIALTSHPSFARCELDQDLSLQLLTDASKTYHTEINDLLLTALAYTLSDYLGSETNSITLEGHGRESIDEAIDVSRTMGWFTTQYPVKLCIKESIAESIQHIKESLRKIPNKGIGFGAFFSQAKLPDVTFNYLGQFDSQEDVWQLADKSSGESVHPDNIEPCLLSMNGLVVNHRLRFNIRTHTGDATLIAERFKARLTEIIQHCIRAERSYYTPSDFNTITISRSLLDELQSRDPKIEAIYKASSLQQGFIYHALSQPDDDAYRVQFLLDYHNPINVDAYKKAWSLAIQTYPILRTYFNWDEDVIQIITAEGYFDFIYHETVSSVDAIQQAERAIAFDLQRPTQLRIHLMKHDESHYTLLKSEHHVIADGWSGPILLSQVHRYYQALIQHITPEVLPDNAYLQAQAYIAANKSQAAAYWQTKLQAVEYANDLNALLSHTTNLEQARVVTTPKQVTIVLMIPKSFLQQQGLTLHVLAQFTWHKLIHSYTRDEQTIVGTTVSGRALPVPGIESSVGLYINTLPLVIDWRGSETILEQLKQIEADVLAMNEHSFAELASLQKDGARLFHSLFVFENYPLDEAVEDASLRLRFRGAIEKLDYPLSIIAYENKEGLNVGLKYDGDCLDDTKAQQILGQYKLIFEQIAAQHTKPHHALNLLTKEEYQQIVIDWNKTERDYLKDKTIHQLFEEQVKRTPNNIAAVFEEQQLTYKQLNEEANQLARYIRKQNPGELVAICMDRSLEMIVAILGILKAGCAYVPIDPSYPQERIDYILEDTKASLVLDNSLKDRLYRQGSKKNLVITINPNDLAYVIYTSGTTGKPKGVTVEHRSLSAFIRSFSQSELYNLGKPLCTLALTHYIFDIFGLEYGLTLTQGGVLVLSDLSRASADFNQHPINFIQQTPSIWAQLLDILPVTKLKDVICLIGGEALVESVSLRLRELCSAVYGVYGPTETTIWSTIFALHGSLPCNVIGRPMSNEQTYILDSSFNPLPIGVIGELYIGGAGLARGYLNQPELTKERFINNPFGEGRLYKTGDLVRWLTDGNIEYIGRNDFQVKIRGYRIELGEIETALSIHPDIKQCVVLSHDAKLIAYYVGQTKESLDDYLRNKLPDYMIPSIFIAMESFPLTINGKLDRKALPLPESTQNQSQYVAPRNTFERMMVNIWQLALGMEKIGIYDDFFKLGGHSILAIHLVTQMNKKLQSYGHRLSIADIFTHKSIANLSEKLMSESRGPSVIKFMNEGASNKKIYFFHAAYVGCEAYQSIADELMGYYHAVGIDNAYLYYDIKINNLTELTRYYLEQIESTHAFDAEIILCGWSLGGNIALEMAYQLEQQGKTNIKVFLLDTVLHCDSSIKKVSPKNRLLTKKQFKTIGLPGDYIKRLLKNMDIVAQLRNDLTNRLFHSEIVLFKATKKNLALVTEDEVDASCLEDNNIGCITDKPVKIIKIDTTHEDIITRTKEIVEQLIRIL